MTSPAGWAKKIPLLLENPEAGYPLGGEVTGFRNALAAAALRG
ncbi:hypothetical protein AB0M95_21630 [Sphaerisporangium sp. NPDC051017]